MNPLDAVRRLAEIVLEMAQDEYPGGSAYEDQLQDLIKEIDEGGP